MPDSPRVISWFKDSANLLEIKIQIDQKIYIYSVPNGPKMQAVWRQYDAGKFGFKQLNTIKRLGRLVERQKIS
jgi:hypothetical protein